MIRSAIFHKVKRFVLVSSDKALRPTNVMGATKRLTKLIMLAYYRMQLQHSPPPNGEIELPIADQDAAIKNYQPENPETTCIAVRFGNVLGSSGSVIPLFKRQIAKGGPVTVTDPEITRYFMSIEEAAQLILQAGAMGKGGDGIGLEELKNHLQELKITTKAYDARGIKEVPQSIIPEYIPDLEARSIIETHFKALALGN